MSDQIQKFQDYLIYSEKFEKIYIGYSSNFKKRLKSQNERNKIKSLE